MRTRALPPGWYPGTGDEILGLIDRWRHDSENRLRHRAPAVSGVSPHAGWSYCGSMIHDVLSSFPENPDTVVVLGGHNPSGGHLVRYDDNAWRFPTGTLNRDAPLSDEVNSRVDGIYRTEKEFAGDNTVEVVMAMAAALYPDAAWTAWRVPADERAMEFGEKLHLAAESLGRRIIVVGSTDLTHYGRSFGFAPSESLEDPVGWTAARDRRELDALLNLDGERALKLAGSEKSACSAGGAVAASAFARAAGSGPGRLLEYRTSYDIHPSDTFVGYGSVIWE